MSFSYAFRPGTSQDYEFFRCLHRDTLKEYVAQIWGWDEAVQEKFVRERFDPHKFQVIQSEGKDIGVMQLEVRPDEWFLAKILLVPRCQRQGWGSQILRDLIAKADHQEVPITLTVLKPNPARNLYERLGFVVTRQDEVRYHMRRAPLSTV